MIKCKTEIYGRSCKEVVVQDCVVADQDYVVHLELDWHLQLAVDCTLKKKKKYNLILSS